MSPKESFLLFNGACGDVDEDGLAACTGFHPWILSSERDTDGAVTGPSHLKIGVTQHLLGQKKKDGYDTVDLG